MNSNRSESFGDGNQNINKSKKFISALLITVGVVLVVGTVMAVLYVCHKPSVNQVFEAHDSRAVSLKMSKQLPLVISHKEPLKFKDALKEPAAILSSASMKQFEKVIENLVERESNDSELEQKTVALTESKQFVSEEQLQKLAENVVDNYLIETGLEKEVEDKRKISAIVPTKSDIFTTLPEPLKQQPNLLTFAKPTHTRISSFKSFVKELVTSFQNWVQNIFYARRYKLEKRARDLISKRLTVIRPSLLSATFLKSSNVVELSDYQEGTGVAQLQAVLDRFLAIVNSDENVQTSVIVDRFGLILERDCDHVKWLQNEQCIKQHIEQVDLPQTIKWLPYLDQEPMLIDKRFFCYKGIPDPLRPMLWRKLLEDKFSTLIPSQDSYVKLSTTVHLPKNTKQVFVDIARTMSNHVRFSSIQGKQALCRLLLAFSQVQSKVRDTQTPYVQSMSFVAAMFLLVMESEWEAFRAMVMFYSKSETCAMADGTDYALIVQRMVKLMTDPAMMPSWFMHRSFRSFIKRFSGLCQQVSIKSPQTTSSTAFIEKQLMHLHIWLLSFYMNVLTLPLCMKMFEMILFVGNVDCMVALTFGVIRAVLPYLEKLNTQGQLSKEVPLLIVIQKCPLLKEPRCHEKIMEYAWKYWNYLSRK